MLTITAFNQAPYMAVKRFRTTTATFRRIGLHTYLSFPKQTYRQCFADHFVLDAAYTLGCLRPPPGKDWLPPPVFKTLDALEQRVRHHWPFVQSGRFFVLEMTRRSDL